MNKAETMQTEYDFLGGVRGKHYRVYRQGTTKKVVEKQEQTLCRSLPKKLKR